ncbi:sensor histidine kinase [Bradyrhizobium sp. NBAIM03]|uniref:histidine kinase n=1 Tax=Bradyrhizobium yuanmingense TaxID=108015 RepID=A0A1C3WL58_9BRAD|nr:MULTISPECIES: sensor histidine kinase [Bradyrhizobium]MCA1537477.1 sensor histidine kinase [Bradyrhizobium sp. NBAIM03]TWI24479.1 two-component system sensor histidine kinase ChvG [Bradyrhizobium yuanmingense]SCB40787.1 two-component system, OmpR family, sensor histidine kinase ChvG [Bradyrhizobium yuanmingense]
MLDRTQPDPNQSAGDIASAGVQEHVADNKPQGFRPLNWLKRAGQFFFALSFSSLTRRIVSLNLAGLVALVASILYLSQFRAGLIDARAQSLLVQAEIIAGAIAASATVQTNAITIDPDRLLDLKPGETYGGSDEYSPLDFPINPERVAPVLRTLISPTKTRARIYDPNGSLLLDSRNLENVLRFPLPPPAEQPGIIERGKVAVRTWLNRGDLPLYRELGPENGNGYAEVGDALQGQKRSMVRVNARGEVIVSVAVPVLRSRAIHGALMLSTQGDDIDQMVTAERLAILKVGGVAAAVMIMLSLLLASTIAGPVRRLADSAERVRRRIKARIEIPDFTRRRDEIGHLSGALRDMTSALYSRIEAIEMFAADVAHELKNPLTSLRSAVETLPLARNENSRARLLEVIEHDVKRLDRLISDISDASRLDAELQRQDAIPVDLRRLLTTLVSVANETKLGHDVAVETRFEGRSPTDTFAVSGHDSRLGQVVSNLLSNAQSFSDRGSKVRLTCRRVRSEIEIVVDDDGPGIREDALERIFERFYTDRPHQGFGQNSGLGLSISKQIVDAHGGRIWAENRPGPPDADGTPTIAGARFVVRLPAL